MTDKHTFLQNLRAALLHRNISESDIAPYIEQFDRFYDRMVMDGNSVCSVLNDVGAIADNIAAQVSDKYDEINRFAERTMTVQTVSVNTEIIDASELEIVGSDTDASKAVKISENPDKKQESDNIRLNTGTKLPDYTPKEKVRTSKKFWIAFALTLPITLLLLLGILGIFIGVWGVLAVMVVGALVLLAGCVALGTVASLIGVIYGVSQLFTSVPIGLYEIGIGVVIAGVTMFAGILIYNLAIRLLPFIIKLVYKLFRFVFAKLKALFDYLRREGAQP